MDKKTTSDCQNMWVNHKTYMNAKLLQTLVLTNSMNRVSA